MADARARRIVEITSGGHKALNYDPHWITLRVRNGLPEHIFEKNPPVGIYPYIPQVISRPGSCNRGTTSIAAARTSAPAPAFPSTMLPGQHPASPGIISRGTPGASRGRSWGGLPHEHSRSKLAALLARQPPPQLPPGRPSHARTHGIPGWTGQTARDSCRIRVSTQRRFWTCAGNPGPLACTYPICTEPARS